MALTIMYCVDVPLHAASSLFMFTLTASLSQMLAAVVHLMSPPVWSRALTQAGTGFGDRAFQVAGPRLWNNLPASLRQSDTTVGQFKKLLKTHLFS